MLPADPDKYGNDFNCYYYDLERTKKKKKKILNDIIQSNLLLSPSNFYPATGTDTAALRLWIRLLLGSRLRGAFLSLCFEIQLVVSSARKYDWNGEVKTSCSIKLTSELSLPNSGKNTVSRRFMVFFDFKSGIWASYFGYFIRGCYCLICRRRSNGVEERNGGFVCFSRSIIFV